MLAVMSGADEISNSTATVTTADALGAELARAVRARADIPGDSVAELARALSLDADRLQTELVYLSILTTQFALGVALGSGDAHTRAASAFERALWSSGAWRASATGLTARRREYRDAFNHPHPELGRGYVIGRTLARHCNCSHEVAAIEFGARVYMEQLASALGVLRSVTVV